MQQIANKEYEKHRRYLTDLPRVGNLTPDGLWRICLSFDGDCIYTTH